MQGEIIQEPEPRTKQLSKNGHWRIFDNSACQRTIHHDGTAKAETESFDPIFELDPYILQCIDQHEGLLETIRWMAQTVHQGNHTDQTGSFGACPKSVCVAAVKALTVEE